MISLLNALKELDIEIVDVVAIIDKGDGKSIVEAKTGIDVFSIVKLDVIDGKVVIESTVVD